MLDCQVIDRSTTKSRFSGLRVDILRSKAELREAFELRYRSYVKEGALESGDCAWFIDAYDMNRTSLIFGVRDPIGNILGSLRFAVQPPVSAGIRDFRSGPEFTVFSDVLDVLLEGGRPITSGARFAIEPGHDRRTEIALLLVYALIHASRAVGAGWGVATARGSHLRFYNRILKMKEICAPRRMPNLAYDYNLLAVDIDREYETILDEFPEHCRDHFELLNPFWGAEVALALRDVPFGSAA